jgi:hypothetical protein
MWGRPRARRLRPAGGWMAVIVSQGGRGHVNLCPLRRRSRGERAPVKLLAAPPSAHAVAEGGMVLPQLGQDRWPAFYVREVAVHTCA